MKRSYSFFVIAFSFLVMLPIGYAGEKNKYSTYSSFEQVSGANLRCINQGFNMKLWQGFQMVLGHDVYTGGGIPEDVIGLEYPAGSGVEHLWTLVPYLGAIMDDRICVQQGFNGFSYTMHRRVYTPFHFFWRTALNSFGYDSIGNYGYYFNNGIKTNRRFVDDDHDGKVDEDELDGTDNDGDWNPLTDDVGSDGLPDYFEVSCNGVPYDSVKNPDPAYDNFDPIAYDSCHPFGSNTYPQKNNRDVYTEKNGLPDHGEPHVDEDYGAISDNDIYCSAADTPRILFNPPYLFKPIKLSLKSYAWKSPPYDSFILLEYDYTNISQTIWNDVYLGFYADMDVGPKNVANFYEHNFAGYDSLLRTAFTHNPIDSGSTPLGLSLIHTNYPFDSLNLYFQWWDYSSHPLNCIDSGNSLYYCLLSGQGATGSYIMPNQSPDSLSDNRFMLSFGPFHQINPGDTIKTVIALVSGSDLNEMKNNVTIARNLYNNNFELEVINRENIIPSDFALHQNYPNPFNPTTHFKFQIPETRFVTLKVYDILGREVATLLNESMKPGTYNVPWDASKLSSGVYFYRLKAGSFTDVKKMVLMK